MKLERHRNHPLAFLSICCFVLGVVLGTIGPNDFLGDLYDDFAVVAPFLAVACWSAAAVLAVLALKSVTKAQDNFLDLKCPQCGHDIRSQFHLENPSCPECGTALDTGKWVSSCDTTNAPPSDVS